jgi:hypothetical protein
VRVLQPKIPKQRPFALEANGLAMDDPPAEDLESPLLDFPSRKITGLPFAYGLDANDAPRGALFDQLGAEAERAVTGT